MKRRGMLLLHFKSEKGTPEEGKEDKEDKKNKRQEAWEQRAARAFLQDAMASQERREGKKNMVGRGVFLFSEAAS